MSDIIPIHEESEIEEEDSPQHDMYEIDGFVVSDN